MAGLCRHSPADRYISASPHNAPGRGISRKRLSWGGWRGWSHMRIKPMGSPAPGMQRVFPQCTTRAPTCISDVLGVGPAGFTCIDRSPTRYGREWKRTGWMGGAQHFFFGGRCTNHSCECTWSTFVTQKEEAEIGGWLAVSW